MTVSSSSDGHGGWSLRRLIDPEDAEVFLGEYYEKKPLIVRRGDPGFFVGLMSLADADHLLSSSGIREPYIRLARTGSRVPLRHDKRRYFDEYSVLDSLYAEYRNGASIIFDFVHERWAPLASLCRVLSTELSAGCQVNAYLTPPGSAALNPHYDSHDVFVLQTSGSKEWKIYEVGFPLPLPGQEYDSTTMSPGKCINSFTLEAGDLLYLPRGYVHEAKATNSISLHLTVGVIPMTWGTIIQAAIEDVIDRDANLRESLPAGFTQSKQLQSEVITQLDRHIAHTLSSIDSRVLVSSAIDSAMQATRPQLSGYLLDHQRLHTLALESAVRLRPGIQWRMVEEDHRVSIRFSGKAVDFPASMTAAVRFICTGSEFSPQELPGRLDTEQRLALVGRLVEEGFVMFRAGQ